MSTHRKMLIEAMAPRIRELLADGYCGDVCLCDPCACAEGAAERALDALTTGPVFEAMVKQARSAYFQPGNTTSFAAALRAALGSLIGNGNQ